MIFVFDGINCIENCLISSFLSNVASKSRHWRCSKKKSVLKKRKILRETPVPESQMQDCK